MNTNDITKMRNLAISDFKGIGPVEEKIWLQELDDRIESAQLLKTWVTGAIKAAKKLDKKG